jgi:hypothetical protein
MSVLVEVVHAVKPLTNTAFARWGSGTATTSFPQWIDRTSSTGGDADERAAQAYGCWCAAAPPGGRAPSARLKP